MWKLNETYSILFCVLFFGMFIQSEGQRSSSSSRKRKKVCSGYGYQVWLSCITDPCVFASCPAFGKLAECRKEISEDCRTCRAAFYLNGRRVNCHVRNVECPPGLPLHRECKNDPCASTECLDSKFKGAMCRGYYCGGCLAEYFVDGKWQQCPNPDVKLQGDAPLLLPEIRRAMADFSTDGQSTDRQVDTPPNTCPDGSVEPECSQDVCNVECPQYPRASCVVNKCGGCKPEFYYSGQLVDCQSTKCRRNVLEMSCNDDPCQYSTCPLYPQAECRPNNCGYCHPEWFIGNRKVRCFEKIPETYQCPNGLNKTDCSQRNPCRFYKCVKRADTYCRVNNCGGCWAEYVNNRNEIVDCFGWWTRYEKRKPSALISAPAGGIREPTASRGPKVAASSVGSTSSRVDLRSPPKKPLSPPPKQTKSQAEKEREIDMLFGDLGLTPPKNSQIVSSSVDLNQGANNQWKSGVSSNQQSHNSGASVAVDNSRSSPLVRSDSRSNANEKGIRHRQIVIDTKSAAGPTSQVDPKKAKNTQSKGSNLNIDNRDNSAKTSRITQTTKQEITKQEKKPIVQPDPRTEPQLIEPTTVNLFDSLPLPLAALNSNNFNFGAGIPIGGWRWRSQKR